LVHIDHRLQQAILEAEDTYFCFQKFSPVNPFIAAPQSNEPIDNNTVTGTLAVDGWAVTFGTGAWAVADTQGAGGPCPP